MSPQPRRLAFPVAALAVAALLALIFRAPLSRWFSPPRAAAPAGGGHDHGAGGAASAPATAKGAATPAEPAVAERQWPPEVMAPLTRGFAAYEQLRSLLAQDRIDGLAAPATLLAHSLREAHAALPAGAADAAGALAAAAEAAAELARAKELSAARVSFAELSRQLVGLAASDARLAEGWHVFSCPMTGGGYNKWFQRDAELSNPYMGSEMPRCGSPAAWRPVAPPPGAAATRSHQGHGHASSDVDFYTCSMHPSVRQHAPGKCPICGMDLAPVTFDESESGVIHIDAARRQKYGIATAPATRAPLVQSIRAVGRLTYDETRLRDVTLKYEGWIVRLVASSTGQPVKKGQVLATVYSPELHAASQEYLLALEAQARSPERGGTLVEAARRRLKLWDLTDEQIAAIAAERAPLEELAILSPASGYVIEKDVVEGSAVQPGQRLFRIASLDRIWVEADVYEADLPLVRVGQRARITLTYLPGRVFTGKIAYVYPYLDGAARVGRVRIELPNAEHALRPDMYADVSLDVELGPRLTVPVSAIVYTGPRRLVFVDVGEGRLVPREVTTGRRGDDRVEILAGLSEGEQVVVSGNFLVSAESRLRGGGDTHVGQ